MSLPLLHAGRTNPGLSAALDLRFALDKSLTAYRGPTPSFSRASTGSYFDGSGVLRYATVNILTYSENFSDVSWTKNQATVTSDSVVAPDGKTTAETLTETSANSTHFVNKASSTLAGTVYTSSIYAKAGTRKYIDVTSVAQDGGIFRRFNNVFDLETGTWQSTASLNSPANTSYSITSVGNGWYRISSSILAYGSTHYLVVYLSNSANPTRNASNDVVYTGNGTGNFYIWGAQLEASSTVGTYCPTTSSANSAPRFDHTYNGTSWVSKGLLVEEQRTNNITYTDFSSGWSFLTGASGTANSGLSPDGTNTAYLLYATSSGTFRSIYKSPGSSNCISVFAKASGKNWIYLPNASGSAGSAWFNLSNGTVGTVASGFTASIQNVGNGWYRCSVSNASNFTWFEAFLADGDNTTTVTANGTDGVLLFGPQGEPGLFPTSFIPNSTSSSVVRSADVCQITGSDFSGFWNGTEGTVVAEYDRSAVMTSSYSGGYPHVMEAHDGSTNNRFVIYGDYAGSGLENWLDIQGGSLQFLLTSPAVGANTTAKLAGCYKVNDSALSFNGAAVTTDTACTIPAVTRMTIGYTENYAGGRPLNGHIARLRYYRKRLPNETLQKLST